MDESELREYAVLGARAKLGALDAERERILAMFPELAPRKYTKRSEGPSILYNATAIETPEPSKPRARRIHAPEFKAELVERIRRGEFLTDVARDADVSDTALRRWSDDAGVKPPRMSQDEHVRRVQASKAGILADKQVTPTATRKAVIARLAAGETPTSISKDLGIASSTIRGWAQRDTKLAAKPSTQSQQAQERAFKDTMLPVLRAIQAGTNRTAELSKKLKIKLNTMSWRLSTAKARGFIAADEKFNYSLTAKGEKAANEAAP